MWRSKYELIESLEAVGTTNQEQQDGAYPGLVNTTATFKATCKKMDQPG